MSTDTPDYSRKCPVVVLGAGAWGTALASAFERHAPTVLWGRDPKQIEVMRATHINERYLPDIPLPQRLHLETDLQMALSHVTASSRNPEREPGLVVLGTPMAALRTGVQQVLDYLMQTGGHIHGLVWTCKGLDAKTAELPHEIVEDQLSGTDLELAYGALSGPSFAREVAEGLPVALTIATTTTSLAQHTIATLHGQSVRVYDSRDVLGVSVGGALKNIMAIACGISDGLALGDNARAALLTRGLAEMRRFGVAMGAQASTFAGLTGLGDLVLTATGDLSRNRQFGLAIGQGEAPSELLARGITTEGARCASAVLERARVMGVSMPITEAVHAVIYEGLSAPECVRRLMSREPAKDD